MKILAFTVLLLPTPLWADSHAIPPIYQVPSDLTLRVAPPNGGFLNLPGAAIGSPSADSPYVILQKRTVKQGFSYSGWAEVAPITLDGEIATDSSGWIRLPATQSETILPAYQGSLSTGAQQQLLQNFQTQSNF